MVSFGITIYRLIRAFRNGMNDPEFKGLFIFVAVLLVTGTTFYSTVEGWRVLDSLYFSVTTLTTIGFGDFSPQTDIGKVFTILFVFIGLGTFLAFINLIAHHATDQELVKRLSNNKRNEQGGDGNG